MNGDIVNTGAAQEEFPVRVRWIERMQFLARDEKGHGIVVDVSPQSGGEGSGPTPGRLLLMSVATCTAIDIVSILQKSRQNLTGLEIRSRGVQAEAHPRYYKEIYLKYILKGKGLDKSRVERAIQLSEEKYCSVGATLRGRAKIITSYEIVEG